MLHYEQIQESQPEELFSVQHTSSFVTKVFPYSQAGNVSFNKLKNECDWWLARNCLSMKPSIAINADFSSR